MATLEDVKAQIKELKYADTFGTKKEIKYLPEILRKGERIHGITSGFMDGNTWLIALTNERVIFLDKGFIYGLKQVETPLDKINSIEQSIGLIFGEISIWDGSSKMMIKNIIKKSVKPFVNAINEQMKKLKNNNSLSEAHELDIASQLERLGELRAKGILTPEEFEQQKIKILAA